VSLFKGHPPYGQVLELGQSIPPRSHRVAYREYPPMEQKTQVGVARTPEKDHTLCCESNIKLRIQRIQECDLNPA
jgi:hypothetical protein